MVKAGERVKAALGGSPITRVGTILDYNASSNMYFVEFDTPIESGLKGQWYYGHEIISLTEDNSNPVTDTSTLEATLRAAYPHGHPHFIPTLLRLMKLHSDKNHDYARGGNPLGNFQRVAMILAQYPDFPYATPAGVAFIYMLKQLDAEAWTMSQGGECKIEGLQGRTDDQLVYAGIRECIRSEAQR